MIRTLKRTLRRLTRPARLWLIDRQHSQSEWMVLAMRAERVQLAADERLELIRQIGLEQRRQDIERSA